jgi:hypothetical protein
MLPKIIVPNIRNITNSLQINIKFLNFDSCLLSTYEPLNILGYFQTLSVADFI